MPDAPPIPLPIDALAAMAAAGERVSALDGMPVLPVLLEEAPTRPLGDIAAWLTRAACPVIGVGAQVHPLARACDTVVADDAELAPLLKRVMATPLAAAIFVQLLRRTETAALDAALFAESLSYSTLQAGPEYRQWLHRHRPGPATHADAGPPVRVEREEAGWRLSLNRPSRRNSMSVEMRDGLIAALREVDQDDAPVHLRGLGKCFSTGGDLDEFGSAPDPVTAHLVRELALPGRELAARAARVEVTVHGACIGSGIEFPAFAGRVVATADAWFQLPELGFGLIPGAGGCVSIPRRIGRQRTAWMVLSGRRIDAATALEWGLVDDLLA